ncbi:MAG: hypothetical protein K2J72_02780 [Oscillospiraceae bacterium]|nr:hypothetical protein [Oscillospiraceae bacterium]
MKNYRKIAAVLSVCVLALAGCGSGETMETTVDTVAAELTETSEEQTSAETAAEEETETTSSEKTTAAETTSTENDEPKAEKYEGSYYECAIDDFIIARSEDSFIRKGGTKEMLDAAKSAVLETDNFKEAYAEITANPDGIYDRYFEDGYLLDQSGNITAVFNEGFCDDFDGDGKKEAFIVYSSVGHSDDASAYPYNDIDYAVFVGSDGAAEVVSSGVWGGCKAIRYSGFIHMLTDFGVNNSTMRAEIFALENGKPVKKHEEYIIRGVTHGFMIKESAPQAPAPWYVFWDNDAREYRYVSNYGLKSGWKDDAAFVIDLDAAAEKTVRLEEARLTDEEVYEMVLEQYSTGAEIAETFKDDYDGDGIEEFFIKTVYSSDNGYSTDGENEKYSNIWAVIGRTCEKLGNFYAMSADNSDVFMTSIGNNKIICIVENIDTEKTYQLVICYTMLNGELREVGAVRGYKIVTDMTSLWLQSYTDENDVQPAQAIEEVFGEQELYENAMNGRIELDKSQQTVFFH